MQIQQLSMFTFLELLYEVLCFVMFRQFLATPRWTDEPVHALAFAVSAFNLLSSLYTYLGLFITYCCQEPRVTAANHSNPHMRSFGR